MAEFKARYTTEDLPLKIMTFYVQNMKDFPDRKNKDKFTNSLLGMLKRPSSVWPLIRLLFPSKDMRQYGMKAANLVKELNKAFSVQINASDNDVAGHAAKVLPLELYLAVLGTNCRIDGGSGMTVGRLNALLDDLRDASSKKPGLNTPAKDSPMDKGRRKAPQESAKGRYLRSIVTRVDQSELQFVLNVILKDDKGHAVGGCETFMKHVHQDAGAVMDTVINLQQVCEKCADPSKRVTSEIQIGTKFRLQMCDKIKSRQADKAIGMKNKDALTMAQEILHQLTHEKKKDGTTATVPADFVVETKFDGWRICTHVGDTSDPTTISMHGRSVHYSDAMDERYAMNVLHPLITAQANFSSGILDGEVVIWNKRTHTFMPLKNLRPVLEAARNHCGPGTVIKEKVVEDGEGEASVTELLDMPMVSDELEVLYCLFDIVVLDGETLTHLPLLQRHQKLQQAVRPAPESTLLEGGQTVITGRLVVILPDPPEPPIPGYARSAAWSARGRSAQDIVDGFERAEEDDLEGVVVKPLQQPYQFGYPKKGDLGWMKWKRDFGESWEVDAVIVGCKYGNSGPSAGFSSFLCALLEKRVDRPAAADPTFLTFVRVKNGLSNVDRLELCDALKDVVVPAYDSQDRKNPDSVPAWLKVAGTHEWPHYWVTDHRRSRVLEVKGDVRLNDSSVYATGATLKFPVVQKIHDKASLEVNTVQDLRDTQTRQLQKKNKEDAKDINPTPRKATIRKAKVAEQYAVVKSEAAVSSDVLKGRKVQILARSTKDRKEKQSIGDLVTSMGGTISASVPKAARRIQGDRDAPAGPQTMDLVIAGAANPKDYVRDLATHQKDKGTEYDVLAAEWLEVCRERGRVVEPLPRHYKHVCDLTLERLADLDGYDAYGTDMFAMLSEEDMQFILGTQMPLVEALDEKKRLLAKKSASSKKAVQEALAGIPALPELTPTDTTRLADSARACMKKKSCTYEEACVARSTFLMGCKCVLLWHPDELEMDAHMGCIFPTDDGQSLSGKGGLPMPQLAAMWTVWLMCKGGTVVASTASNSAGSGTPSCCPKHASKDNADDVTHVVLMPTGSCSLLAAGLDLFSPNQHKSQNPKKAMSLASGRPHEYLHDALMLGMGGWTGESFACAMAQLAPTYEAFEKLATGLAAGRVALCSAAALIPEVFTGPDAGLINSSLSLPQHSSGGTQQAGTSHDAPEPLPMHMALRGWLQGLTWPELGFSKILKSALKALEKLENPQAKKKGKRKRDSDAEADALDDSDVDVDTPGATPAKHGNPRRRNAGQAGKDSAGDVLMTPVGASGAPDDSVDVLGSSVKKPASVASRFAQRKRARAAGTTPAKALQRAAPSARDELSPVAEAAAPAPEASTVMASVSETPQITASLLKGQRKDDITAHPHSEDVPVTANASVDPGMPGAAPLVEDTLDASRLHTVSPQTQLVGGGRRGSRKRGAVDPAFADDDVGPAPVPSLPSAQPVTVAPVATGDNLAAATKENADAAAAVRNVPTGPAAVPEKQADNATTKKRGNVLDRLKACLDSDSD